MPGGSPKSPSGIIPKIRKTRILGGAAGNHTVTGIAVGDLILYVWHHPVLNEAAPNTFSAPEDLTSEFSVSAADTINNTGGTDTTGGWLEIDWFDPDWLNTEAGFIPD